jgi:undecaprenyl-diphosphatase
MYDLLNSIDIKCFHFINTSLSNSVFDIIMPVLTDLNQYRIVLALVAAILLWMIIRGGKNARLAAVLLIITIVISDQFSSSIVKHWFERPRPCSELENVHLLVGCGKGASFPSSHAVNNFAGAFVLAFFFSRFRWWFFGFAFVIAFSRVYVGVHYPFDVIGGGIIGLLCGGFVIALFLVSEKLWFYVMLKKIRKVKS